MLFNIKNCLIFRNDIKRCYILINHGKRSSSDASSKCEKKPKEKFNFSLDPSNHDLTNSHQRVMHMKLQLPSQKFFDHVAFALEDYSVSQLQNEAQKLLKYIWSRHLPLEEGEKKREEERIKEEIVSKELVDPLAVGISESDQRILLRKREMLIKKKLKMEIYHWERITYDAFKSRVYLIGRFLPDFTSLCRVFNEIVLRDPSFSPSTFFDFGSGVGTGIWAVQHMWPYRCREALCIDSSSHMMDLADKVLKGPSLEKLPFTIFYRQFLPMSDSIKYNLVISSRSMFELPDLRSRIQVTDVLWKKVMPGGYLVIIEAGTNEGYKLILECRDYILGLNKKLAEGDGNSYGSAFAPCPHDHFCPRFLDGSCTPCNFRVGHTDLPIGKVSSEVRTDMFSYVILRKGNKQSQMPVKWPRIVRPVLCRARHVVLRTCMPSGILREYVATKKRHGKDCYRVARNSEWGDLFPVVDSERESRDNEDFQGDEAASY